MDMRSDSNIYMSHIYTTAISLIVLYGHAISISNIVFMWIRPTARHCTVEIKIQIRWPNAIHSPLITRNLI